MRKRRCTVAEYSFGIKGEERLSQCDSKHFILFCTVSFGGISTS